MAIPASGKDGGTDEHDYLRLFLEASELLGASLDYRDTLQNVADAAVAAIADLCLIDIGERGETNLVGVAHRDGVLEDDVAAAVLHLESADDRPLHPVCKVLESGTTFFAPYIDDAWIGENATREEHGDFMSRMGYTSMIVVAMKSQIFGITGALTLVTVRGGRARYTHGALRFAESLARLCAASIGKAKLYDESRATATMFQRAALPQSLRRPAGVSIFTYYQPAAPGQLIGGDWYDAFILPDGRFGLCIGDVSGHGLEASVAMSAVRNALRSALIMEPNLGRAIDTVDFLWQTEFGDQLFCTASLAILDPESMTLRVASAGHPGPKVWDPKSRTVIDPFLHRDLPLGLRSLSVTRADEKTIRIEGGMVVFYTDGIVECGRDFLTGERALEEAIASPAVRDAADPALAIRNAVPNCDQATDDMALMVIRID